MSIIINEERKMAKKWRHTKNNNVNPILKDYLGNGTTAIYDSTHHANVFSILLQHSQLEM